MRLAVAFAFAPLLIACPQTVVVYPDGAVPTDAGPGGDAAPTTDAGSVDPDGGATDTGQRADAGPPADGGADPCQGLPYCLTVSPTSARVNVRESVTLETALDNPQGLQLRVDRCQDPPAWRRGPDRPPLVYGEIGYELATSATNADDFTFSVNEVPPWFFATTFDIALCVYEGSAEVPALRISTEVHVRGNVLISAQYQGVFAVASDGRPAAGIGGRIPDGMLLDDTITSAGALRLASDGTLLVLDANARPSRIARYGLDGQDVRLQTFEYTEQQLGVPEIYYDNVAIFTLAELPDGGIALANTHNSGTSTPRVMIWNSDGTFRRQILGGAVNDEWRSVAARGNELLIGRSYNIAGDVIRLDLGTGAPVEPPFAPDVNRWIYALEPLPDGRVAVGAERLAMVASDGGGAISINDIPGGGDYRAITGFDDMLLFANEHQGDSENVAVVDGRNFVRWLRVPGSGGPVIVPYGLAYLE